METQKLPSALQIGDYADVIISEGASLLDEESILTACKCINVHFGLGSVRYDFEVVVRIDTERHVTRVYNIDSAFVHKRNVHHIAGMNRVKMIKINRYINDQKVFDASWYNGDIFPRAQNSDSVCSDDVLIDIDGNRKHFVKGWYDFDDKKWRTGDDEEIESAMKWQYLPLSKYDKL